MPARNYRDKAMPISAFRDRGYAEAEAMLGDLIPNDQISDTSIRIARDHMIQFARNLPERMQDATAPSGDETCASPLGQSGMTCSLPPQHGGTCAAVPNDGWNSGWLGEPPVPIDAFVGPLDDEQFATLLATIDAKIIAEGADAMELAWLLTVKLEISRLRTENSVLLAKSAPPAEAIETAAMAIAMNRLRHYGKPIRWPADPDDVLSAADGSVPIDWDAAQAFRQDTAAALGATPGGSATNAMHDGIRAPVELADRERAWPFRPACYSDDATTKAAWMAGVYDAAAPIIGAFSLHRANHA